MKKNLLLIAFISVFSFCLSAGQRVTLVEHFTGANCGPCADANPKVDPIYERNFPDVIVIKYQVAVNYMDPLSAYNYPEASARSKYYNGDNLSFVPWTWIDGSYGNDDPRDIITDANLTAAKERPSDWEINLDYTLAPDGNIKVDMDIKSLTEQTGKFVAHIVLIEKDVNYATAPGSNGEKNFKYVMRKMLPDSDGTTLKTSWTENEEDQITEEIAVPLYCRNLDELAIVAFIQNNTDKTVCQAAYAEAKTLEDAVDVEIVSMQDLSIGNNIPKVTIKSSDIETLTSAIFKLEYPDGTLESINWVGSANIGVGEEVELTNLPIDIKLGSNAYSIYIYAPNGLYDSNLMNNTVESNYVVKYYAAEKITLPLKEDFELQNGNPALLDKSIAVDWNKGGTMGIYGSGASWKLGANNSERAFLFRNYNNTVLGDYEDFYLPTLNVEDYNILNLAFYYAYCPRNKANSDTLLIHVSTNDGETWNEIFRRASPDLNTNSSQYTSTEFFPQVASTWKKQVVSLSEYVNSSSLLIRFRVINGNNNTLSLDQIEVTNEATIGLNDVHDMLESFATYMHNDILNIDFTLSNNSETSIKIYDILGSEVYSKNMGKLNADRYIETVNVTGFNKGVYMVILNINGESLTQKILVK